MATAGCLEFVFESLKSGNIENIESLFKKLCSDLNEHKFVFPDISCLLNKGICRCHEAEWCVPSHLKGDVIPMKVRG